MKMSEVADDNVAFRGEKGVLKKLLFFCEKNCGFFNEFFCKQQESIFLMRKYIKGSSVLAG